MRQAASDHFDVLADGSGSVRRVKAAETVTGVRLIVERDLEIITSEADYGEVRHRAIAISLLLEDVDAVAPTHGDLITLGAETWKVQEELANDGVEVQFECTRATP